MMESTYSVSSFSGLVSSKRRLVCPPNSLARPKSRQIALACPMCKYPFGSGGKRVCTRPSYLLVLRSSRIMSRIKFDGRGSSGTFTATAFAESELIFFSSTFNFNSSARQSLGRARLQSCPKNTVIQKHCHSELGALSRLKRSKRPSRDASPRRVQHASKLVLRE